MLVTTIGLPWTKSEIWRLAQVPCTVHVLSWNYWSLLDFEFYPWHDIGVLFRPRWFPNDLVCVYSMIHWLLVYMSKTGSEYIMIELIHNRRLVHKSTRLYICFQDLMVVVSIKYTITEEYNYYCVIITVLLLPRYSEANSRKSFPLILFNSNNFSAM